MPYSTPPIDEAFCQFSWVEQPDWNIATPGVLFENLKLNYPETPEQQAQIQASFEVPQGQGQAGFSMGQGPSRVVYKDSTQTRLLVADQGSFSVNSLRPYEGWSLLRARLRDAAKAVGDVTGAHRVGRISLRYLNRVVITGFPIDTDEYFNVAIQPASSQAEGVLNAFVVRTQTTFTQEDVSVAITFASLDGGPPNEGHFLLDIEYSTNENQSPMSIEEALAKADQLKAMENQEFENLITDSARALFR